MTPDQISTFDGGERHRTWTTLELNLCCAYCASSFSLHYRLIVIFLSLLSCNQKAYIWIWFILNGEYFWVMRPLIKHSLAFLAKKLEGLDSMIFWLWDEERRRKIGEGKGVKYCEKKNIFFAEEKEKADNFLRRKIIFLANLVCIWSWNDLVWKSKLAS